MICVHSLCADALWASLYGIMSPLTLTLTLHGQHNSCSWGSICHGLESDFAHGYAEGKGQDVKVRIRVTVRVTVWVRVTVGYQGILATVC